MDEDDGLQTRMISRFNGGWGKKSILLNKWSTGEKKTYIFFFCKIKTWISSVFFLPGVETTMTIEEQKSSRGSAGKVDVSYSIFQELSSNRMPYFIRIAFDFLLTLPKFVPKSNRPHRHHFLFLPCLCSERKCHNHASEKHSVCFVCFVFF